MALKISLLIHKSWLCIYLLSSAFSDIELVSLKLAMVEVFSEYLQKLASATNQGFCFAPKIQFISIGPRCSHSWPPTFISFHSFHGPQQIKLIVVTCCLNHSITTALKKTTIFTMAYETSLHTLAPIGLPSLCLNYASPHYMYPNMSSNRASGSHHKFFVLQWIEPFVPHLQLGWAMWPVLLSELWVAVTHSRRFRSWCAIFQCSLLQLQS